MFMSDVHKKEEIRTVAVQELRKLGVKYRPKKPKQNVKKSTSRVFNVPLAELPTQTVTLKTGQQIVVPKLVHDMCSYILTKVDVEGVFRKEGSKARQNEIRKSLSVRSKLDQIQEYHVIDVAVILKTFLRELPEPLIPYGFHELFLLCVLLQESKLDAILLACLLLPLEHLNLLSYLMQFFYEVAENSHENKMTPFNLAVVIGPSVFPIEEKSAANPKLRTEKTCELFRLLIENAKIIGVLPEHVIHRVGNIPSNGAEEDKKRRKRRSGSLTRMFNGLKKIVGGKSIDETSHVVTPDLLMTPINRSAKKRRVQANGLSIKKKRELISNLPDSVLLNTPFTPQRTPVNMNLSGTNEKQLNHSNEIIREKKAQWFSRSRSVKNLKHDDSDEPKKSTKTLLERRWSAVNQACNIRRNKKRNSSVSCLSQLKRADLSKNSKTDEDRGATEPDYVRVPKNEFEEFINKVSAIERRISSFELENVQSRSATTNNENNSNAEIDGVKNVQTAYEQTLVQAEPLCPTTDQLARRLSRDLKIRRSAEQKIIRSPSARKIGSMRRRSRELERNNLKLTRHQSWHVASKGNIPRVSLKRGKPNTVTTGLPVAPKPDDAIHADILELKEIKRTPRSSLPTDPKPNVEVSCNLSGSSNDTWMSAEGFFTRVSLGNPNSFNDRASLAKLRSQNAGMVLAKAKLFDNLKDSDGSTEYTIPRPKIGNKIGSARNLDRVKALKSEERRLNRKSMSPRRRNAFLTNKHRLAIKQSSISAIDKENLPESFGSFDKSETLPFKDCNRSGVATPRATPQIKKTLNVRSPKRLCRTPGASERGTPLKVLATPARHLL